MSDSKYNLLTQGQFLNPIFHMLIVYSYNNSLCITLLQISMYTYFKIQRTISVSNVISELSLKLPTDFAINK